MYWGVTILSGRRYTQTVEKSYHISKAVLEIPVDGKVTNKRVQLMLEHNNTHYLLSNLDSEKIVQVDLDLIFTEGEEVTFYLNGDGVVHLSGYVLDFGDEDDFDGEFDEEGISDEESEDEELTNENSKRVIKAVDSASNAKKAKVDAKALVANGIKIDDSDDDEEDEDKLDLLGNLDEEFDSDEDEEDDDDEEDDEEDDDVPIQAAKPASKLNGQAPKQQQQQKGTPAKGQQQNPQKNIGSAGKPNNQTPKGGQPNQNKFGGQKGQNTPQGQKPNPNQKGPQQQQQKGGQQNKQQQFNNKKGGPFTPDQKAGKKLTGGLQVNDLHVGSGPEARKGKFVHVRYVGKLPNNKEFDRSSNKPFSFRLGAGEVIKGWDLGLEGMKVGGKRKIVVPPQMGYGSRSMGVIPANSTLHFDVELVSIS